MGSPHFIASLLDYFGEYHICSNSCYFWCVSFKYARITNIIHMIVLHSVITGILAMPLYTYAVKQLGAPQTAAFGAITPILSMLGGVIFLDELITPLKLIGICLVTAGVLFASGALIFTKK